MRIFTIVVFLVSLPLACQSNNGELRIQVTDPAGLGVKTTVQIVSGANQYHNAISTSNLGYLDVQRLPYGIYRIKIEQPGFAVISKSVEIKSSLSSECRIQLKLPTVNQSVSVRVANPLIDSDQAGSISQIGTDFIRDRVSSLPGRDLEDLVNSQPGWLY